MPKQKMELTIERDGNRGGSYRRRLDDAFKALGRVRVEQLRPEAAFVFYWLTCEKVAKVMVGIERGKPGAGQGFNKNDIRSNNVIKAWERIKCSRIISDDDVNSIFSGQDRMSACSLRNRLFHDFGKSHVKEVQKEAPHLNRLMSNFLRCRDPIIAFLNGGAI